MNVSQWNHIEAIVDDALDVAEKDLESFIRDRCNNDGECIRQVQQFLDSVKKADTFFSKKTRLKDKITDFAANDVSTSRGNQERKNLVGKTFGAYTLVRQIGEGGMGAVYLAKRSDGQFEHTVAIKLISQRTDQPDIYSRFLRERQILAGLSHDNIARLYDGGVSENDIPYLVMEYVNGTPIDDYSNRRKLSLTERLKLFKQVCYAVKYAHKNLVIHRDVKPENILITDMGSVKIMDFGIAKLIPRDPPAKAANSVTSPSRYITFSNASPEQISGDAVTTSSDIYALGILLYRLLAGVHPMPLYKKSSPDISRLIKSFVPPKASEKLETLSNETRGTIAGNRSTSPKKLCSKLRGDLDAIIHKCLQKNPENRYQTVEDLLADLGRYKNNYPVRARERTKIYYLKKFVARNNKTLAAAALFLLFSIVSVSFYTYQVQQQRDLAQIEADKAKQVTGFVMDLFRGSDPNLNRGDNISARDLLNRGIERTNYLSSQPEIQASMLIVLGQILIQLGEYDEAEDLITKAMNLHDTHLGENHLETIKSYEVYGTLLSARGNFFEAEDVLEDALDRRAAQTGEDQAALSEANTELGYVYRRLGKHEKAENLYRRLIPIYETTLGPDDPLTLLSISSLGATLHGRGNLDEAETLYQEVLNKRVQLFDTKHPKVAMSLNNLGALFLNKGKYDEAEDLLSRSLQMRIALFGETHPKVALTMNNLGILKRNRGDFESASEYFTKALNINKSLFGSDALQTAINMFSMAELYIIKGETEKALDFYKQSHNIFSDQLPDGNSFTARAAMGIGEALIVKNPQKAEKFLSSGFNVVQTLHAENSVEYGLALAQYGKFYLKNNATTKGVRTLVEAHKILSAIEGDTAVRPAAISDLLTDETGKKMTSGNR